MVNILHPAVWFRIHKWTFPKKSNKNRDDHSLSHKIGFCVPICSKSVSDDNLVEGSRQTG